MINKKIKIFITFLLVLMLIMAGNFVFASNLKNNKSIHQIDSLKHLGIKANEFKSTEDIIPLSTLESPRVKKTILGYYPYWMDDSYKDLNYNLLTDIVFHAIFINSQGEIIDENGWPYVGLINKAHASGVRVILSFTNFNFDQIAELLDS